LQKLNKGEEASMTEDLVSELDIGFVSLGCGKELEADTLVLQYIGAAVLVGWNRLPPEVKAEIKHRMLRTSGLPATSSLQEQAKDLFDRNEQEF
jgi:hypothetical protein